MPVVPVAEERGQPLLTEGSGLGEAGILLQERQRDRAVKRAEDLDRSRPEPLELGAQLVAQRRARRHEILPPAAQRSERLGLVAVGLEHPEAAMIVRASSHSTNASKPPDLPPETPNRGRAAVTWLGCKASTRSPASSSRSTSTPSGRSIATSSTFKRTSWRHSDRSPASSCANDAAKAPPRPRSAGPRRASQTPSRRPRNYLPSLSPRWSGLHNARPRGTVAGAH